MSEVKWTDDQLEVIADRGNNLLVSASAGSGKTTVMTKRIVDLVIKEKVSISNFLIVTFTKASAEDMKKKIVDKLLEETQDEFTIEQIESVATSDISDLHSFYSRLISTYFYEVDIDPTFHIIDELESTYLKNQAIQKLFEEKSKRADSEFFRLVDIFQKKRQDSELKQVIFDFSGFLASHIDGEKWFFETLENSYNTDISKNICAKKINDYVCTRVKKLCDKCDEFADECLKVACEKYYNYFCDLASIIKTIKFTNNFEQNAKLVFGLELGRLPTVEKDFKFLSGKAKSLSDNVKKEIKNFEENFISADTKSLAFALGVARKNLISLYNLTREFEEAYSKIKKDNGGLDFNDLEKFAYKILCNEEIRKAVQQKYKYVFVDEYQDINAVQEKILSMVSSSNNRFMVGDLKQSIYRFRLCDPEIFLEKYKAYSASKNGSKVCKLNCNFRSDKKILKFVDSVFAGVMTEDFGEIDYAKDSIFEPGESNLDLPCSTNLCFIDTEKEQEKNEVRGEVYSVKNHRAEANEEELSIKAEARYVGSKIAEILEENKNRSADNQIKLSDFAILVFARNAKTTKFIETLNSLGIAVSADDKYDMMAKNYIREIVNFAKYLILPNDDYLLFSVLKSKLFNFDDSELKEIRMLDNSLRFYDVIALYKNLENVNLRLKMQNFYKEVNRFKSICDTVLLPDLLKIIVKKFKLFELNLIDKDGVKINEEIDKFILSLPAKSASEFFVERSEFSLIYENECGGDAVKLMTIHKSKGIEFKYVFLINTSGQINFTSSRGKILFNKDFGVGLDYFDSEKRVQSKTIASSWVKMIEGHKLAEEAQRVLYVALTRAVEKMFVVCSKKKSAISEKFPERPTCYCNWFEPIIFKALSGESLEGVNFEKFSLSELSVSSVVEPKQLLLKCDENVSQKQEFNYAFNSLVNIPLKTSVSKILKSKSDEMDFDDEFESAEIRLDEEALKSSADRGTAYHRFFELLDLKNLDNFDEQVAIIKTQMETENFELVDIEKIRRVINLEFFKQLQANDIILKEREFFANVSTDLIGKNLGDDKMILQGVVDLIVIRENEIIILDYKTGKMTQEKLENYSLQLNIYADAVSRGFNMKVSRKILLFIDEQKFVEI